MGVEFGEQEGDIREEKEEMQEQVVLDRLVVRHFFQDDDVDAPQFGHLVVERLAGIRPADGVLERESFGTDIPELGQLRRNVVFLGAQRHVEFP
jgi:hypothetical protein